MSADAINPIVGKGRMERDMDMDTSVVLVDRKVAALARIARWQAYSGATRSAVDQTRAR